MLRVRLEILPDGDDSRAREVGRLDVCKVSPLSEASDYSWLMWHEGGPYKTGIYRGHARKAGAWRLLRQILGGMNMREFPCAEKTAPQAKE
jgi:hypothetical protein